MKYKFQLTLQHIFWRVENLYKDQEIVWRNYEGKIERYTYLEFAKRSRKLASFFNSLGLKVGDRIATLEWNTRSHLEAYMASTIIGLVLHIINVRFHPSEIEYVIKHFGDKYLLASPEFSNIANELKSRGVLKDAFILDKEFDKIIESQDPIKELPMIDEDYDAIACYTSGTTGKPKGIVYTHRTTYLNSLNLLLKDVVGITKSDTVLVVVPMFHINGWNFPFASLMIGAKLVLPGPRPKSKDLAELIQKEKVTIAAGAPTVWIDFLDFIERENYDISSLKIVVTGGAEPPRAIAEKFRKYGVKLIHAWGMTETEAIASINNTDDLDQITKQGIPVPGIEMKLMSIEGENELPWDGKTVGELWVSGAWVASEYYNDIEKTKEAFRLRENKIWLRTGDLVTIDEKGYIKVVDRLKDIIKSGGEWISSIDLENAIASHPKVLEAAVVGVKDERWGERPIALVVPKKEYRGILTEKEIVDYLISLNRFPKWWIPDKIIFVEEIPKTSTGKIDKKLIRDMYGKKK
ncbi:MAG: long-chain fatty acid--CoA ligase [Sulfolobaceae archaeon]